MSLFPSEFRFTVDRHKSNFVNVKIVGFTVAGRLPVYKHDKANSKTKSNAAPCLSELFIMFRGDVWAPGVSCRRERNGFANYFLPRD